jgi:hypothetical protein
MDLLNYIQLGVILTLGAIGYISMAIFPIFLELNDELNKKFKDETPSRQG